MAISPFDPKTLCAVLVVGTAIVAASAQAPAERSGPLAVLKRGMPVTLKEVAGRCEIGVLEGELTPLGHEVVEVGADYVVVTDIAHVTRTYIPVYALACVRVTSMRP